MAAIAFFVNAIAQQKDSTAKIVIDSTAKAAAPLDSTAKPAPPVTITGSIDGYYRFNFSNPKFGANNYTSFTNSQSSFELGMASIRADHSFGKVSATVDLGFGRRAEEFSYNDAAHPTLFAVKQAYVSYQASSKIKFTMGKWGTHIGYEVLDAYSNRNYSMDYMFTTGPFSHTGIKAEYTKATWHFMLGAANPTNVVSSTVTPMQPTTHLLAQIDDATKNGKWHFYLNFEGAEGMNASGSGLVKATNQFDFVATGTISSKFSVGLNLTDKMFSYNSDAGGTTAKADAWGGGALYLNWDPTALFGLTLRSEYFIDNDGLTGLGTQNILDETLSANFRVGPLTIIPELRYESADTKFGDIYVKGNDATPTGTDFSGILAAVYKF